MPVCRQQTWKVLLEYKEKEQSNNNNKIGSTEDQKWKCNLPQNNSHQESSGMKNDRNIVLVEEFNIFLGKKSS